MISKKIINRLIFKLFNDNRATSHEDRKLEYNF